MSLRYVLQDAMLSDSVFQALHEQLKCLKRVISRFPIKLLPQEKFSTDAKVVQIHRYYILLTVFKENWFIQDTRISKLTYFFSFPCVIRKKKNLRKCITLAMKFQKRNTTSYCTQQKLSFPEIRLRIAKTVHLTHYALLVFTSVIAQNPTVMAFWKVDKEREIHNFQYWKENKLLVLG